MARKNTQGIARIITAATKIHTADAQRAWPTTKDYCAASAGIVRAACARDPALLNAHVRNLLMVSGIQEMRDLAQEKTGICTFNTTEWAILLRSTPVPTIVDMLETRAINAENAAVPLLGAYAENRTGLDPLMVAISTRGRHHHMLRQRYHALLANPHVAPHAAYLLRAQVAAYAGVYQNVAINGAKNRQPFVTLAINAAGMPWGRIFTPFTNTLDVPWYTKIHASKHAMLALQARIRSLEHLLKHKHEAESFIEHLT